MSFPRILTGAMVFQKTINTHDMSKIEDITIQRIIEAANIVDVVGEFIELKKKGTRYFGLCPFHDDHSPDNFSVYPPKNCYTCFACGAKGDSVKFLQEHAKMSFIEAIRWLGQRYGIPVDDVPVNYTPPPRREPKRLPMFTVPHDTVLRSKSWENDTFVKWIYSLPWNDVQHDNIKQTLNDYLVGHSKRGHTIFWQIDDKQIVRTGKMILYNEDGHRCKDKAKCPNDWIHAMLFRSPDFPEYNIEEMEMIQCLFGQHLMNAYKSATINIVESEKTAIIMSIACGNRHENIWMACGGLNMLSRERLAPLMDAGRRIQLFPDRDGIKAWKQKAMELNYYNLGFNTDIFVEHWKPEDGEKADIADIVIRLLNEKYYG